MLIQDPIKQRRMIEAALESNSARVVARLRKRGEFEAVVQDRLEVLNSTYDFLVEEAAGDTAMSKAPYLDRVGELYNALSRAAEEAIAQATEPL